MNNVLTQENHSRLFKLGNFFIQTIHDKKLLKSDVLKTAGVPVLTLQKMQKVKFNISVNDWLKVANYLNIQIYWFLDDKCPTKYGYCLNKNLEATLKELGSTLKKERLRQKLGSEWVSKAMGVSRPTLQKLENGCVDCYLYYYLLAADVLNLRLKIGLNTN